jgi:hypothetical protein
MQDLYLGEPVSSVARNYMPPLTEDEKYTFRWKRLCGVTLQEDFSYPFPLARVDFDWRCSKLNKWYRALNLLLDTHVMDYGNKKWALVHTEINANMSRVNLSLPW